MKIPSLKSRIGNWDYYITTLTFAQVNEFVSKIDENLYKSKTLKDLIQRSITDNFLKIKDYILNQPEFFFNALVLAVYNDYPKWIEIEFTYDNLETYQMGLLEFPGSHKIFPVDGQHRVEGIKAALAQNPELENQRIAAIFIGHKNDEAGKQKTRRLFTTLNRYAKPVTMDDIIALDEDDSAAITTRYLLENFNLFNGNRITKSKNKAIPDKDKNSITSIITLYQCNREILKVFRLERKLNAPNFDRDKKSLTDYLKFRPEESEINLFENYVIHFWNSFLENIEEIQSYSQLSDKNEPAKKYRNRTNGGNLLFRPVGLLPFIQAVIEIKKRTENNYNDIFTRFNKVNFTLNTSPWKNVLWNPTEKTMIMGNNVLVKLMLIYIYDQSILTEKEFTKLKQKYADRIGFADENIDNVLNDIPKLN